MVELSSLMIAWDGREVFGVWASMAGACGALDKWHKKCLVRIPYALRLLHILPSIS